MSRFGLMLVMGVVLSAAPGCANDASDSPADAAGAADLGMTSSDVQATHDAAAPTDVPSGPVCEVGLDEDGDGICDRLAADWSRAAKLPESGSRADIYRLGAALPAVVTRGIGHSLDWPVEVSGMLLPWKSLATLFDDNASDDTTLALQAASRQFLGFGTLSEMYDWLGLARYDGSAEVYPGVAWPAGVATGRPLGVSQVQRPEGLAMSYSCATCHTAELFGRTVVGLTNRSARANEYFHAATRFFPSITDEMLVDAVNASEEELELFRRAQGSFGAIGVVLPQVLGLDTSLAQVALSLSRREADAYATRNPALEEEPRPNALATDVADSKPAVWWTLKYKTRWLCDGSIVSGNPVFTNFLWNELGRGTDLHELQAWLEENRHVVDELTAAVFAVEAPRWADFFGADSLDVEAAKRGQALFEATCSGCHGSYDKGWDAADAASRDAAALTATTRVRYHAQTPVLDVGTDPQRAAGMAAFADRLNDLAISQWMGTFVEVQTGYVPPPLNGIWARYPYLHNHAVPTLCDLLTPGAERPAVFWMGPSDDPETDFDATCVGFPTGAATPAIWMDEPTARFDTSLPGLSNRGHDAWLIDDDGKPRFGAAERADLIEFLKTL